MTDVPALDLRAMANEVSDEASFVRFLAALAEDWEHERRKEAVAPSSPYGPGANGWENGSIGAFLESAAAWAKDTANGTPFYKTPDNPVAQVRAGSPGREVIRVVRRSS